MKAATSGNRNVLEVVLMKGVLTVAINNIGNPSAMDIYFDQSFLKPASQKTFSGKIPVLKTITVDSRIYKSEQEIKLFNNGDCVLVFSLSPEKDVTGASPVILNPQEEKVVTASELGDVNTCKYLNVENKDADLEGDYKVVVDL